VYALKYIAKIPTLDSVSVDAIVAWCSANKDHEDAVSRFASVSTQLVLAENRIQVWQTGAEVLASICRPSSNSGYVVFSGMKVLEALWHLPIRNAEERACFEMLGDIACSMWRAIANTTLPDWSDIPHSSIDRLVAVHWQALLLLGISRGQQWDVQLREGLGVWATHCLLWAVNESNRVWLLRLKALSELEQVPPLDTIS
jgi:hypothetical protein